MSYCLNPQCKQRLNADESKFCQNCGQSLLLRGRFRILRPLGRGGFGRTYLALDRDRLDTPCAIKQFLPTARSPAALKKSVQLFSQEALRLRELGEHLQIPALLAYFQEEGCLYIAQEFIPGPNLAQEFQRQGPFSEAQIVAFLRDLLPVLQFVHDRQTIHRDLKPANLIRRKRDGRLVVIDFGVAKYQNLAPTPSQAAQPGTKIGTEGYSPAEQLRGGKAYPASDLYSVGAICVFLLTGVHPEELYNPLTGRWPWREQLAQWGDAKAASLSAMSATTVVAEGANSGVKSDAGSKPDSVTGLPGSGSDRSPAIATTHPKTTTTDKPNRTSAPGSAPISKVDPANGGGIHTSPGPVLDYKLPAVERVSEGLGRIIDKLLEENVLDRYQSATAVMADLDRLTAASTQLPVSPFWRAVLPHAAERDRRKRFWRDA